MPTHAQAAQELPKVQTLAKAKRRAPRWEKPVSALTAYAPHGTGLFGGVAAIAFGASRPVAVIVLIAGTAAETAKTMYERYEKRKGRHE
jgi:hypothetical protein